MNKKEVLKEIKKATSDMPPVSYKFVMKQFIPELGKVMDVGIAERPVSHKRRAFRLYKRRKWLNAVSGNVKLKTSKRQQRLNKNN